MERGEKTTPHLLLAAMETQARDAPPAATAEQETEAMMDVVGERPVQKLEATSDSLEGEQQLQHVVVPAAAAADSPACAETAASSPTLLSDQVATKAAQEHEQQHSEMQDARLAETKGSATATTTTAEPLPDAKPAMEVDSAG